MIHVRYGSSFLRLYNRAAKRHLCTSQVRLEKKGDESGQKNSDATKGFFSKIKSDFVKELSKSDEGKAAVEDLKRRNKSYKEFYKTYFSSKLPEFAPKEETSEPSKFQNLKARFDKDKLVDDYSRISDRIKNVSINLKDRTKQMVAKKPLTESEGDAAEAEPEKEERKSRLSALYESDYYKKASNMTSEYLDVSYWHQQLLLSECSLSH